MKLINNTPLSDAVIESVLLKAGRSIGVRTANVVVQVNRARFLSGVRGTAYECCKVRWIRGSNRWLNTDGGAFRISLPLLNLRGEKNQKVITHRLANYDSLRKAELFFEVARHEWGHILDYQNGGRQRLIFSSRINGRREAHDRRPEEIRTENYAYDADQRKHGVNWAADEVLALGLALEEHSHA